MENDIKLQRFEDVTGSNQSFLVFGNRTRNLNLWRSISMGNLASASRNYPILESAPSLNNLSNKLDENNLYKPNGKTNFGIDLKRWTQKGWTTQVSIVLVEAKGIPNPPCDGSSHDVYCKVRLGSQTIKSKPVPNTQHLEWKERIKLYLYDDHLLRISLWDKGKMKNFMGSCVLDLSELEHERTHEVWKQLDDGFGLIHLSITMCNIRSIGGTTSYNSDINNVTEKHVFYNLSDWKLIGELHVKVIGARGLPGKPNSYCILEVDNEGVQTHSVPYNSEPIWNKTYVFKIYDVTSTLDFQIQENSSGECLGKVFIPLLRINNGEPRWYALKGKNKRSAAKGNCPRALLEMTVVWNPIKAAVRVFQPKEVQYIKTEPKFNISLVYSNLEFIRDTFNFLKECNEKFKRLFEWESQELSVIALLGWLMFWHFFRYWTTPLLLLIPFISFWASYRQKDILKRMSSPKDEEYPLDDKGLSMSKIGNKLHVLQDMTITITYGIEYAVSLAERIYNLVSFKVPFLSYLTMMILVIMSVVLYYVPFNHILMAFGTFKFTRKCLNPDRIPNNDILDFLSRIPDKEMLKDWYELSVPEPNQGRGSYKLSRSTSSPLNGK